MNIVIFAVGTVIFSTYIAGLVWNMGYRTKESKKEKYGYYSRHSQPEQDELK
jgi:hypothetical protein